MLSPDDVATALKDVARRLEDSTEPFADLSQYDRSGHIRDLNGNTVGDWAVSK